MAIVDFFQSINQLIAAALEQTLGETHTGNVYKAKANERKLLLVCRDI